MEHTTDDPTPEPQQAGRDRDDASDDQSPENLVTHGRTGDVLHRPPTPTADDASDDDADDSGDADQDDETGQDDQAGEDGPDEADASG